MKETTLAVDGLPLAFYEKKGSSVPVFCLHGLFSNANAFDQMLSQPCLKDMHFVAIDFPGHGKSGHAQDVADYRFLRFSEIVAKIIEERKFERVILVGHSVAGHIAMHVPVFTKRIAGMFLMGAAPLEGIGTLNEAYDLNEEITSIFKGSASDETFYNAWLYNRMSLDTIRKSFDSTDTLFQQQVEQNIAFFFSPPHFTSEIKLLEDQRVAFIHGEQEKLVRREYLESLHSIKSGKHQLHILPGAAHWPHLEVPQDLSRLLADFVIEVSRS